MSSVPVKNEERAKGKKKGRRKKSRVAITTNCIVTRKLRDYSVASQPPATTQYMWALWYPRERKRARNAERIWRGWEESKKEERKREKARAAHNYRLYFQIVACEFAASSNCSRHWIFIASPSSARRVPSANSRRDKSSRSSIWGEPVGYAFALNPFRTNGIVVRHRALNGLKYFGYRKIYALSFGGLLFKKWFKV